jgi:polysaccharide export outer membrane protein
MRTRKSGKAVAVATALAAFVAWAAPASAQSEESSPPTEAAAVPDPSASEPAPAPSWPAEDSETPAPAAYSGDAPDYEIGPADMVRVTVWRSPELSAEVPVRPDGRISVPLLGDVAASGLTTSALREKIASGLSEYVTAPDVTVVVTQVNSKVVFLVGEVARPTAVPLNRRMRVLDAISMAGGFTPFADKGDVKVLRSLPDGSVEEHEFDYGKFVKGKKPESNLVLEPGDTIVVPD